MLEGRQASSCPVGGGVAEGTRWPGQEPAGCSGATVGFWKLRADPVSLVSSFPRAHGTSVPLQWAPRISLAFREEPLPRPLLCIWQGRTAPHTQGNPGRERGRANMCQTQQALQAAWGALAHGSWCSLPAVFPSMQCVILMISPLCKTKDLKLGKDDRAAQSKGQSQALNLPFSDSQGRARLRLPGRGLSPVLHQMGSPLGHWLSSAGRFPQQKRAV